MRGKWRTWLPHDTRQIVAERRTLSVSQRLEVLLRSPHWTLVWILILVIVLFQGFSPETPAWSNQTRFVARKALLLVITKARLSERFRVEGEMVYFVGGEVMYENVLSKTS